MFNAITLDEHGGFLSRDGTRIHLSVKEQQIFMPLWRAAGVPIDRIALNKEAYPECARGGSYVTWNYASAKVILCKLRKKLVKVGLLIETIRVGQTNTYESRAYKLVDVAAKPVIYPKAEAKTEEQAA